MPDTIGINLPMAGIGFRIVIQTKPSSKFYDSYLLDLKVEPHSTVVNHQPRPGIVYR
jgi:hypothetical protein